VPYSHLTSAIEAAFRGLVMILQRYQQSFDHAKGRKGHNQDQRQPQNSMHPVWRLINDFRDQCGKDNNEARNEDYKHGRAIAGIGKTEIETAVFALWANRQKSLEQMALTATRTATAKTAADRQVAVQCLFGHAFLISK